MTDYSLLFVGIITFCAGAAIGAQFGWGRGYTEGATDERRRWVDGWMDGKIHFDNTQVVSFFNGLKDLRGENDCEAN